MVRPGVSSLASALAVAALVVAACSGGASPTSPPAASGPQATTVTAAATGTPAATPPPATGYATPVAPAGVHNGRIAAGVRAADGSANIFATLPDGTDVRQLTTGTGNHLCAAYSADGNTIAYCADVIGPSGPRRPGSRVAPDRNTMARIDPASNTVVATLDMGGFGFNPTLINGVPWVSADRGAADSGMLVRIDPATNTIDRVLVPTPTFGGGGDIVVLAGSVWVSDPYNNSVLRLPMTAFVP